MHVIYGTRYIDEIVRIEKQDYGTLFVFQDATWNVTSALNYATAVLDRVHTSQPTFDTYTINADYDADGDLDSSDESNFDTCNAADPPSGPCRVFDFDNDADIDATDETQVLLPKRSHRFRESAP